MLKPEDYLGLIKIEDPIIYNKIFSSLNDNMSDWQVEAISTKILEGALDATGYEWSITRKYYDYDQSGYQFVMEIDPDDVTRLERKNRIIALIAGWSLFKSREIDNNLVGKYYNFNTSKNVPYGCIVNSKGIIIRVMTKDDYLELENKIY